MFGAGAYGGAGYGSAAPESPIGGGVGTSVTISIVEIGSDVFSSFVGLGDAPSPVAVSVAITEVGSDIFSATAEQVSGGTSSAEPVSLSEAKAAANIDPTITAFDSKVIGIITAARQMAEHETGRDYVRKTKRYSFTEWPAVDHVMHVFEPTAVAITWWNGTAWVALDASAYGYFEQGLGTGIAPALDTTWPVLGRVVGGPRVRVDITSGSETPRANTPECVKLYIKALVAHWVDNPSAASDRSTTEVPFLGRLLDPERLWN